jgi:hypothetical protein
MINSIVPMASPFSNYVRRSEVLWTLQQRTRYGCGLRRPTKRCDGVGHVLSYQLGHRACSPEANAELALPIHDGNRNGCRAKQSMICSFALSPRRESLDPP